MYNFKRLIDKYSKVSPYLKVETEGYPDYENGGQWVEGKVEWVEFKGAVLPLGKELLYESGGYTTDDKKLYTYEDIGTNKKIKHKDVLYTTMELDDYSDFDDDLEIMVLKRGDVNAGS